MRIGFDAKRYFNNFTGLGNYSRWLINNLNDQIPQSIFLFHSKKLKESKDNKTVITPKIPILKAIWRSWFVVRNLKKEKINIYHGLSNELPFGIHKTLPFDCNINNQGETNYTYRKMIRLAIDAITSFSNWPLRLATISGFVCAFLGFILILYTLYAKFILKIYEPGWPSLMISIVFLGGIQLLGIGMIGEYIARINDNVKKRPLYLVDETNIKTHA